MTSVPLNKEAVGTQRQYLHYILWNTEKNKCLQQQEILHNEPHCVFRIGTALYCKNYKMDTVVSKLLTQLNGLVTFITVTRWYI